MEIRNCIFSERAEKKHLHRVDSHCKKDKAYIHTWYKNLCWNHQWMQTIWWEYIERGTVMVVVVVVWCNRRIPSRVKRRKEGEDVDPWVRAPSPSCGQSGNLAISHLQEVKTIEIESHLRIFSWGASQVNLYLIQVQVLLKNFPPDLENIDRLWEEGWMTWIGGDDADVARRTESFELFWAGPSIRTVSWHLRAHMRNPLAAVLHHLHLFLLLCCCLSLVISGKLDPEASARLSDKNLLVCRVKTLKAGVGQEMVQTGPAFSGQLKT